MKKTITKSKIVLVTLFIVLGLASFLRICKLDKYPAGLNADEAAIGYNDYSLILTGKDEHGTAWPVNFKSFGDYKPGLYFYLALPLIRLFGLNIWAVRLPSAILGTLSVWLVFLLVKELFKKEGFALLAAFFLAISPWHLHFSRGGWESNAGTFFLLLGVYLFFKSLASPRLLGLSFLSFVASMYAYHSMRIIAPLLGLALLILYRQAIFKKKKLKFVFLAAGLGFLLLIPLILSFFGPAGASRFSGVGILADTGPIWRINELRGQHQGTMSLPARLFHNRLLGYAMKFGENFFDHFRGEFLFLTGDEIPRSRVPGIGQLYLFDIILLPLGIYFFLRKKPANWQFVFSWLAISPLAAAMTFQTPHALRAHNMVVPLTIISAFGFYESFLLIKARSRKLLGLLVLAALFLLWNLANYLHQYYFHYPRVYPYAWEDGFEELVDWVRGVEDKYDKIYVTDRYDQPYILFLFYLRYPPKNFQKEVVLTPRDKFGFSTVRHFDKFYFEKIDWEILKEEENVLIVGTEEEIPSSARTVKEIYFKNGKPAFKIVKSR